MQPILAHLREELLITLLSPQQTDQQDPGAVDGEQRADGVEFGGEDLEDDSVCMASGPHGRFRKGLWAYREKENWPRAVRI